MMTSLEKKVDDDPFPQKRLSLSYFHYATFIILFLDLIVLGFMIFIPQKVFQSWFLCSPPVFRSVIQSIFSCHWLVLLNWVAWFMSYDMFYYSPVSTFHYTYAVRPNPHDECIQNWIREEFSALEGETKVPKLLLIDKNVKEFLLKDRDGVDADADTEDNPRLWEAVEHMHLNHDRLRIFFYRFWFVHLPMLVFPFFYLFLLNCRGGGLDRKIMTAFLSSWSFWDFILYLFWTILYMVLIHLARITPYVLDLYSLQHCLYILIPVLLGAVGLCLPCKAQESYGALIILAYCIFVLYEITASTRTLQKYLTRLEICKQSKGGVQRDPSEQVIE